MDVVQTIASLLEETTEIPVTAWVREDEQEGVPAQTPAWMDSWTSTPAPNGVTPPLALTHHHLLKTSTLYWLSQQINRNKYYVILPLTIICNLLVITVVWSRVKKSSAYYYIANIALWDMLATIFKSLFTFSMSIGWVLGDEGCGALYFMIYVSGIVSNWLVVFMTVDRLLAVWFPLKLHKLSNVKISIIANIILVLLAAAMNAHHIWTWHGFTLDDTFRCLSNDKYDDVIDVFSWVYVVIFSIAPTMLLLVLNTLLSIGIHKKLGLMTRDSGENKDMVYVTIMALIVSVTFTLLLGPYCGFVITTFFFDFNQSTNHYIVYRAVQALVIFLADINRFINVFLYTLAGRRFRNDAMAKFGCLCVDKEKKYTDASRQMTVFSTISNPTDSN